MNEDPDLIVRVRRDARNLVSGELKELNEGLPDAPTYFALLHTVNESYRSFVLFLEEQRMINRHHVLLASNMIHAWKSGKFILNEGADLEAAAVVLNRAREKAEQGKVIDLEEFEVLVDLTHDQCISMATKLLHLTAPAVYSILDKHVYRSLRGAGWEEALEQDILDQCFDYWQLMRDLVVSQDVSDIQRSVSEWLGYKVTEIRAIELILYIRGKLESLARASGCEVIEPGSNEEMIMV